MLAWLLLSLWQLGGFPLAGEASYVITGFRFASSTDDPLALGTLLVGQHLPLSYLPSALGAHMLPVSDFTMRLPYALIGAAQMPLLLAIANRSFGARAAGFAGIVLLGTGLFGLNRVPGGISLFIVLELASVLFLLRYREEHERRWLLLGSLSAAAASLVYIEGLYLVLVAAGVAWATTRSWQDRGFALLAGPGLLAAFSAIALLVRELYSQSANASMYVSISNMFTAALNELKPFSISPVAVNESLAVYIGVPGLLILLIGVAEALFHNRVQRATLLFLIGTGLGFAATLLVLGSPLERHVVVVPLFILVAGFGWSQLIKQLDSPATQAMVALCVASVAMAGVVWNQAVFTPGTEFTERLSGVREFALSLRHGTGLSEDDGKGLKALAQVIRDETPLDSRVLVRDGVSAAAVELYAARSADQLSLSDIGSANEELARGFLVVKGEDEAFNAGLNGTTTVVANHRVFSGGESLYQLIHLDSDGEPFDASVWWRADAAAGRLAREHSDFPDYLAPLSQE